MTWKLIARSVIGKSHLKRQMPCQDYGGHSLLENKDIAVGAVADGAGSAKHSEIGAKVAVETVLRALQYQSRLLTPNNLKQYSRDQTIKLFKNVVHQVFAALEQKAQQQKCAYEDLACTIVAFIATSEWLGAMQIGDGFLVNRLQGEDYRLLLQPDKGEFINETTFVTSKNALQEMQVEVSPGQQEFICASTDGLERVAIRLSDWTPFPPFFHPLEKYLEETQNPELEDQYLLTFLNSERLNARTSDDKTLLLGQYQRGNH